VKKHSDNYIPADPMVTPASIVPEWYIKDAMLKSNFMNN
jgi:quinol-cytochrome oxidoreductase complex cytochrome b subunit